MACWTKPMGPLGPCFAFESGTKRKFMGEQWGLYFRVFKTFLTMAQLDTELALQYRNHSHTCAFLYVWTFLTHCIEFLLFEATDPNPLNWFHKPLIGSQPTAWKFLLYLLSVLKAKDKYLALLLCFKSGRPICGFAKSHLLVTQILQAYLEPLVITLCPQRTCL